jgi:hypothetical protein
MTDVEKIEKLVDRLKRGEKTITLTEAEAHALHNLTYYNYSDAAKSARVKLANLMSEFEDGHKQEQGK